MKTVFGRKLCDMEELKDLTERALKQGRKGQDYLVTREVELDDKEFRDFTRDFLEDQPWITKEDGGMNKEGQVHCIRVINKETGKRVLVNNEGYFYARYVALEYY